MALIIWARDTALKRRGQLQPVSGKVLLRESAVGTWQFEINDVTPASKLFDLGWGIIVYEDGELLFSGTVTELTRKRQGQVYTLAITGQTDLHNLADRPVLPDPTREWHSQTTTAYYSRLGAGHYVNDLIADLVNLNAGPSAISYRQVFGLQAMPNGAGNGTTSTVNARFTSLLDEVRTLAHVGNYVVDVVQEEASLKVVLRERVDRSRYVRFWPNNGLGDTEFTLRAPTATVALVLGQGQGTARTIVGKTNYDHGAGPRRIEVPVDRRDTDDTAELNKAADETLAEGNTMAAATFKVIETPSLKFGKHYQLGDRVTVAFSDTATIADRVTSADIAWDGHGRTVDLTVGENRTGELRTPAAVREIRALQKRVKRLEAQ